MYLHWANSDQYYIKTAEHFHDYTFTTHGITVHFKLTSADVEQNNVKGEKRFFLPVFGEIEWREKADELVIPFEFRPLTNSEKGKYGKSKHQDGIIAKAITEIPKRLGKAHKPRAAITAERDNKSDDKSVTFLEYHLRQYTRRNTSDFFIHKDLKGFLSRELDFYLKNEVLNLDEMEAAGEDRADSWFQTVRTIKRVGGRIIEFLHQIESFQKMLWEKRKFVTETQYCITVGNIDERFYSDIAGCETQWDEWKKLFHIDDDSSDLFSGGKSERDCRAEFLQNHPTLVLDTKHFCSDFKDLLIGSIDDLNEKTDGLLIHSENWQALSLLTERYREQVKCIYIDPPYNTASSEIVYKNNYKHSSWITLISNRVELSKSLLSNKGISISTIDHEEFVNLGYINDLFFGKENRLGIVTVFINPKGRQHEKFFSSSTEYMFIYAKDISEASFSDVVIDPERKKQFTLEDKNGKYRLDAFARIRSNTKREKKPNFWYPIYVSPDMKDISSVGKSGYRKIYPVQDGNDYSWKVMKGTFEENLKRSLYVAQREGDNVVIYNKFYEKQVLNNIWTDKKYFPEFKGTQLLKKLFGEDVFSYPKSVHAVSDILKITSSDGDTVLDYFSGSGTTGHAVINLNREDAKGFKFVLVEMGEYFDTVILPRIKKVTFSPDWKDGKPNRMATKEETERSPRIVKYLRLESYEDALNNIAFDHSTGQKAMKFNDYLMKYMLKWETKRSETLLNVEKLANPFDYKLHTHVNGQTEERLADVPETFNYLLGLRVRTRQVHDDDGRRYLVYRGEVGHQQVAVIWRETEGWQQEDFERDKRFVKDQGLTKGVTEIYVNGDSFIPGAKPLEPVFKARMFAPVEG